MLREKQENLNHSVLHTDNRNQCDPISIPSWLIEFVRHLVHKFLHFLYLLSVKIDRCARIYKCNFITW